MKQQHWSNDPTYRYWRGVAALATIVLVAGCATVEPLMPTPTVYVGQGAKPLFVDVPADRRKPSVDLLYITDRAPGTAADKTLPYSADRSRSMAFGSVTVEIGEGIDWSTLVAQSTVSKRSVPLDLALGPTTELGRFPPVPYTVVPAPTGMTRDPTVVQLHEKAAAALQAEVTRRLADSPRKEVVLYVHGYANTFQDASFTMGDLCHFLGREFVCSIFTWPAGGSSGLFFGYNVDRESGEFAVHHLKQAIRIVADTPGVQRVHLLAHSRGTDVLASALRELTNEAYVSGMTLQRYKIANVVLMSPDIDADVAVAKIFGIFSDPDLAYGQAANPRLVFPPAQLRLTVYTSDNDKALTVAEFLMGSLRRLGRLDENLMDKEALARARGVAGFTSVIHVTHTSGFVGHSYFLSDPAVSADLMSVVRYGLGPGDSGRQLEEIERPFWKLLPPRAAAE